MSRDSKTKRYAEQLETDLSSDYATKPGGTTGNFVSIAASGDLADAGYSASDLTQNAIIGDAVGRNLRQIRVLIEDGTNASTIKVTATSLFNGDAISATDNVAKGATTGDFSLDAAGEVLTIEASGLTGNAVMAQGTLQGDTSNTADPTLECRAISNDITLQVESNGVNQDLTALADVSGFSGIIAHVLYLTDA